MHTDGRVYLNDVEKLALGFHIKHGPLNPTQAQAEAMLQRLSSDGIRFMVFNFAHWETDAQVLYDLDFWMPLLYKYKMWVFLQVQHLDPEPPILDVAYELPRQQLVIDRICQNPSWANMVYAATVGWELDIWYNNAQVTTYLQAMVSAVKTLLRNSLIGNVPILNKPCGMWGYDTDHGIVPLGTYADLPGLDYYGQVTAAGSGQFADPTQYCMDVFYNTYLLLCNKVGCRAWPTEFNISNYGYGDELTPNLFTQFMNGMGHGKCGSLMIWLMWTWQTDGMAAFNTDGTPKQWYLTLSPSFRSA